MSLVKIIDLTGVQTLSEILFEARTKNIKLVIINVRPDILPYLLASNIRNNAPASGDSSLDEFLVLSPLAAIEDAPEKDYQLVKTTPDSHVPYNTDVAAVEMVSIKP